MIDVIRQNPSLTYKAYGEKLSVSQATVKRLVAKLKETGSIRREGSQRKGTWIIRMVGIIVGRRAAAGAGFASAMLRIRILAPCTSGIAATAILRCGVSAGAAGCRSAVLTGGRIAPRPIAHAVAGIVVVRRAAVSARTGAPVLAGRILLPASITVTMTAGVDGFAFGLTASA